MKLRALMVPALTALVAACGGRSTEVMEYGGHLLEPKAIIFAHIPLDTADETLVLISDQGDACTQFDGLGCLAQPLLGTSLLMRVDGFGARRVEVGDEFSARWLDFQGVRPLEGEATSGSLEIEVAKADKEVTGTFQVELPEGRLENGFTADLCKPMRDYYLGCREERP